MEEYELKFVNGTNMVEHTAPLPLQEDKWLKLDACPASTYLSLLTEGAFFQVGWSWSELNT